jgi:hypothetical protein
MGTEKIKTHFFGSSPNITYEGHGYEIALDDAALPTSNQWINVTLRETKGERETGEK